MSAYTSIHICAAPDGSRVDVSHKALGEWQEVLVNQGDCRVSLTLTAEQFAEVAAACMAAADAMTRGRAA